MFRHVPYLVAVLLLGGVSNAIGQAYPTKTIRMITTLPGGGSDITARMVAQELRRTLGQTVVVENRATLIAMTTVAKSPPDGYTLLSAASALWISPLFGETSFDPIRDFAPITLSGRTPTILVVHPSLPVKSVKELIAFAKARPGVLNYGAGAIGSSNYLAAELFNQVAGVKVVNILYKGTNAALTDLVAGNVHMMFAPAELALQQVRGGKLRALAVSSPKPSSMAPGLPTVAASGLPGFEAEALYGLWAPAGIDSAILDRLNREIVQSLNRPEIKEKLASTGVEADAGTPEEFNTLIKAEIVRWKKVIDRVKAETK